VEADPTFLETDPKALTNNIEGSIQLELVNLLVAPEITQNAIVSAHSGLPKMRFLPDGSIGENSPQSLRLTGRDGGSLFVGLSRSRMNYEIRSTQ
jgi:hypothetical protein